jgi:hypothetical protein
LTDKGDDVADALLVDADHQIRLGRDAIEVNEPAPSRSRLRMASITASSTSGMPAMGRGRGAGSGGNRHHRSLCRFASIHSRFARAGINSDACSWMR